MFQQSVILDEVVARNADESRSSRRACIDTLRREKEETLS